MTQEEKQIRFIEKCKKKFNKFDYSKVEYINGHTNVCITCPEHGDFFINPYYFLSSIHGCPLCGKQNRKKKCTTEKFLKKAKEVHGDKYDYSKVVYKNYKTKVPIICSEHGEFYQSPFTHLSGCGCPTCGRENGSKKNTLTTEEFIKKAKEIHGNKYDYSKVKYVDWYTPVTIICPEHGEFQQRAGNHLSGCGCFNCGIIKRSQPQSDTTENFIKKARKIHGNKYDYSKIEYINSYTKVCIICPEHGEFWQKPASHLQGSNCPKCSKTSALTTEEFIKKAKKVHGDKYDYSKVEYKNYNTHVTIICPEHGEFQQKAYNHLKGNGCFRCNRRKYTYEYCYNVAKKFNTIYEFRRNNYNLYYTANKNNWVNDYTWLKKEIDNTKAQTIYVYEFNDKSAYVGLTNDINRRDYQHRSKHYTKGELKYDGVLFYSIEHNIEIPEVKILKTNLTREESQKEERYFINEYRKNGWNMINKNKGGSLGAISSDVLWTRELIIEESKKYKTKNEMRNKSRTAYNKMIYMNISKECFPNGRCLTMKTKYIYTEDFLKQIKQKYPIKKDLRKNEFRVYRWLWKNNRLYEFYPN